MNKLERDIIETLPEEQKLAFISLEKKDQQQVLDCVNNLRTHIKGMGYKSAFEVLYRIGKVINKRSIRDNGYEKN